MVTALGYVLVRPQLKHSEHNPRTSSHNLMVSGALFMTFSFMDNKHCVLFIGPFLVSSVSFDVSEVPLSATAINGNHLFPLVVLCWPADILW